MRDLIGTISFAVMLGGVSMISVPWAMIIGGGLPFALIVYGYTARKTGK